QEVVRTPSQVAVAVMRYTDHVMLVGEGARRFARAMGFRADDDLLTDASRARWLELRARLSPDDDWLVPEQSGEPIEGFPRDGSWRDGSWDGVRPMGTIHCSAVDRE